MKVEYEVVIGGETHARGPDSRLLALQVSAALRVPVNACRVTLHGGAASTAAAGDTVTVQLGFDGEKELLFTGVVAGVTRTFTSVQVEALGSFTALLAARLNQSFETSTAGDIVTSVLGQLAVAEGTVEAGPKFASFTLDQGRSAWAQLAELAGRCGFDFFADEQDQAQFRAYQAATTHPFAFGEQILDFEQDDRPAARVGVEVFGASPAGQGQGEDASDWLTKKLVKGTAGETSGSVLRVRDAAARTPDLAGEVAAGWLAREKRVAGGRLRVLGAPVRLGDAIQLEKLPDESQNGEARVTGVRHLLDGRLGFVTDVSWERSE